MMRFKAYAQRGEKAIVKSGNCHIEHTAIFCLCYAVFFLYLTSYAYVHLTLYKDVLPMIQVLLNLFLTIALSIGVAIFVLVRIMFCMQRYKCSGEMVFSGQMNNIIECDFIRSTDCMHAALANLLFELIMVRGGVLSLPTWFSRDLIDGVLSSVCV